jgi:hypothetical protein
MKCHAFCACNKIIIDKDGAHSIIEVMLNAEVKMTIATSLEGPQIQAKIPPNALAPSMWWLYTQWEPSAEDVGQELEQVFQVYWPNGEKFTENRLRFKQQDDRMNQTSFYYGGFPVGQQGKLRLVTWIDREGQRVSEVNESFVLIKHTHVPDPNQQGIVTT